jgi:hypothetical protein
MERYRILKELIVNAVVQIVYHRRDITAMHPLVLVVLYHHAVKKMVLQPIMLPVSAGQLNVHLNQVCFVIKM